MNKLKFDKIVKSNLEDITVIEYGIIEGNNTIVFIKSGQNGQYMVTIINILKWLKD